MLFSIFPRNTFCLPFTHLTISPVLQSLELEAMAPVYPKPSTIPPQRPLMNSAASSIKQTPPSSELTLMAKSMNGMTKLPKLRDTLVQRPFSNPLSNDSSLHIFKSRYRTFCSKPFKGLRRPIMNWNFERNQMRTVTCLSMPRRDWI